MIVARDDECRAPDDWYRSNQTQPDRNQPWYHVLVDGTSRVTYAAHTSLESDDSGDEVHHPLVAMFFEGMHNDRYVRNDRPWPSTG